MAEPGIDTSDVSAKDDELEGDYDDDTSPFASVRADRARHRRPRGACEHASGVASGHCKCSRDGTRPRRCLKAPAKVFLTDRARYSVFIGSGVNQFFSLRYPGGESWRHGRAKLWCFPT